MGACCNGKAKYLEDLDYKQNAELRVIEKDKSGAPVGHSALSFRLSLPTDQMCKLESLVKSNIRVSGCVLPGIDPRGECEKECQDSYGVVSKESNLCVVLLDGHGKDGRRVSLFCKDFMLKHFEKFFEMFEQDPQSALEEMIELCDVELGNSGIECQLSGTTAVVIVINSLGIHAGSVGDSRAILASTPKDNKEVENYATKPLRYKRPVWPTRALSPIAMTIDQKPNHEGEMDRIIKAGGVVEKIADETGKAVGPFRVWKRRGNLPGLAMSRSIGDHIAHGVGVISTPIYHSFPYYPSFDQFIVIASDGIWDVMENIEVVNFVEKFRKNSSTNTNNNYPARITNSNIARLLCEEARYRWFGVIENEDVMIDDISCVIIELGSISNEILNDREILIEERKTSTFKTINLNTGPRPQSANVVRNDPTRGSMTSYAEEIEKALNDLKTDNII